MKDLSGFRFRCCSLALRMFPNGTTQQIAVFASKFPSRIGHGDHSSVTRDTSRLNGVRSPRASRKYSCHSEPSDENRHLVFFPHTQTISNRIWFGHLLHLRSRTRPGAHALPSPAFRARKGGRDPALSALSGKVRARGARFVWCASPPYRCGSGSLP